MGGQSGRLQVLQQPYCTQEKASSKNLSCTSLKTKSQCILCLLSKPLNLPGQTAGSLWFHISFFRGHLKLLPRQIVLRPVTYQWGFVDIWKGWLVWSKARVYMGINVYIVMLIDGTSWYRGVVLFAEREEHSSSCMCKPVI